MMAMFALYLRDPAQGFWLVSCAGHAALSNYLMFVYASPLIGGWLADKKLGYRRSVLLGGLFFMAGYFCWRPFPRGGLRGALVCLVIGNGFFKPNVSAMVGHLYPEGRSAEGTGLQHLLHGDQHSRLLAPINAEIWVDRIGYNWVFAIAGLGMIVSVAILWTFKHHVEGAQQPRRRSRQHRRAAQSPCVRPTRLMPSPMPRASLH